MNADTPPVTGTFLSALALKECKSIAKSLGSTKDRHRGIHEARKAIRRLRSLLSLVAGAVGHDTAKIDLALKKQAKRLCALRDSHVAVTIAEKLAVDDATGEWGVATQVLAVQRDLLLEVELSKDPGFARRIGAIGDIAAVFEKLRWKRLSEHALQRALKKSHRRVTRSEHEAAEAGTPASLHRWRRRVRRLRMQLDAVQALNKLAGVRIKAGDEHKNKSAKVLAKLADKLGWQQDIQVLRAALRTFPDPNILASLRKRLTVEKRLASN